MRFFLFLPSVDDFSLLKIWGAINKENKIFIKWNLKFQKAIDKYFAVCYNLMEQGVPIQNEVLLMRAMNEEKLQKLAEYIKQYARENNGESPRLADIMEYMNMAKSSAYRYVLELEKRGIVSYNGKKTLESPLQQKMKCSFRRIPILGMVICGTPDEQEEHVRGYLAIPEEWVDGECFLLEAYGDSMVDIGIDDGDYVLVKKVATANSGDVIVALTENGNTLKRLFWENGKPRLHAENKTYPKDKIDIYPSELIIQGIALKVVKDIR